MRKYRIFNISVTILISLLSIYLGVFYFNTSYLRFFETLSDFGNSIKFYFCELFGIAHITPPTVEQYSDVMKWEIFLPEDFQAFSMKAEAFWNLFFNGENFGAYCRFIGKKIGDFSKLTTILLPCIMIIVLLIKRLYGMENTDHNKDTFPLKVFKRIANKTYQPIKRIVRSYIRFLRENRYIPILWTICWSFHLNLASMIMAFFAYYFYFSVSFRFETMYVQIVKLFIDLQVLLRTFPPWSFGIIGYIVFDRFRRKIAQAQLRRMEARNCGFINELPIVSMTCGSMGKKKTTIITDMALSQEVMFRQKAFELLKKNDMKFPHFPWIEFEMELRKCMEYGTVYNLATIKEWVRLKEKRYKKHRRSDLQLYGYDTYRYGMTYNDALKIECLHDVLEAYAQLYFIYVIESSLLVANYSIRTDNQLLDRGNFPMWATDFFPETTVDDGRHAHILDFDVLRLGKKVIENNPNAGSFEFGVVVISEVGKERGNVLDHKEIKKHTEETNHKNDLFNSWLKMCRHSATVDNFPFIKVFTDEQRPESWGADARDLCDIVNIATSGKQRLCLPFYIIEDMICETLFDWFIALYYNFRYRRGDNTLLIHILKSVTAWLYKKNVKVYNRYGYSVSYIEKERGTMDGKIEKKKYYVMNKKIYASRFSTDCFSDYFNDMAKKTNIGLDDYLEYETERATVAELKLQNSYFINALYKNAGSN